MTTQTQQIFTVVRINTETNKRFTVIKYDGDFAEMIATSKAHVLQWEDNDYFGGTSPNKYIVEKKDN